MDLAEKLEILADSAKYDVACTSKEDKIGEKGQKIKPYAKQQMAL